MGHTASSTKEQKEYSPKDLIDHVHRNELQAVEAILKQNSHLANKLYSGRTLLYPPCRYQQKEMAELLLKYGVGVNNCYKDGTVPLWTAIYYNHNEIVQLLIENGANVEQKCHYPNFNALDYAVLCGRYTIALYLYNAAHQNKHLKTAEEYEVIKKEFCFIHYTNYSVFIEGLLKGTPLSEMPDFKTRPKKTKEEETCCECFCGLFVLDYNRELNNPQQPQVDTHRKTLSANPK